VQASTTTRASQLASHTCSWPLETHLYTLPNSWAKMQRLEWAWRTPPGVAGAITSGLCMAGLGEAGPRGRE
jgi:hypothetical protein